MRRSFLLLAAMAATAILAASAHHSFGQFNGKRTVLLNGTVVRFEWTNPHGWLWVTLVDHNGGNETWGAETKAVSGLMRDGWTKRSFRRGDKVQVYIHPMYSDTHAGEFIKAILPSGLVLQPHEGSPGGPIGSVIETP